MQSSSDPVLGGPPVRRRDRGGFRWWHLSVFLLPLSFFIYITVLWAPGDRPIVGSADEPFFVGTILRRDRFTLDHPETTLQEPSDEIRAAACHNYNDWLDDVTLNPDLVLVTPDSGLLRSAELLDGEFQATPVVLEAERIAAAIDGRQDAVDRMGSDDWSDAELEEAERYLEARSLPPSPGTRERYVFYIANVTTRSLVLARLEVDPEHEIRNRPSLTRTGDISVGLPDGSIVGVNESACWT